MHGDLGWRKSEDHPSAARIDVLETEHVGQEGSIGVRVAAEDDEMGTVDHPHRLPRWTAWGNDARSREGSAGGLWPLVGGG